MEYKKVVKGEKYAMNRMLTMNVNERYSLDK
jgi:hypothetical protein